MNQLFRVLSVLILLISVSSPTMAAVRLKELGRIEGVRDNVLIGYGLVAGLAGSGDSRRSESTTQSIVNTLRNFNVRVEADEINSRNVAAVVVTAELPPFIQAGDRIAVNLSSLGDARSLLGGTLLMTPLKAANGHTYALAQGAVSVGGFQYEAYGNRVQKNHPTVARIPNGAIIEQEVSTSFLTPEGDLNILLTEPDFTTANRVVQSIREAIPDSVVKPRGPGKISVTPPEAGDVIALIARIENITVEPDQVAKVVVNERTGTVVSGGDVRISAVSISHGNIEVSILTDYQVSQPANLELLNASAGVDIRTVVTPQTRINLEEQKLASIQLEGNSTVNELVKALKQINVSTRDLISILQSIKSSGALHARLIIN
ncbi:flagellar basal body P-ring protein FlgI [Parendozoicomonas haliclonae]|uniref:Flagellar P-ring protein n=1 Tax=Parendozoicomonas haliclonae TaxID=1960125 RepID=A0A1X7AP47_9GAMM|nr:flagellar basal body P-ring protein FlgI [Parendozoicomonas haliclonae]SMA49878.1 Flagellar P-ring protein precursor [Parendozoicomonas haliclonae]